MLLGIVLHAEMAYMTNVWSVWPADDPSSNGVFDITFGFIHLFRMQVFFVMAGFFACMLFGRYGDRRFAIHRFKRIAIPLALATVFINPLWHGVSAWGHNLMAPAADQVSFLSAWGRYYKYVPLSGILQPVHLWFLQHLLVMYTIAIVWMKIGSVAPPVARVNALATNLWCWCVSKGLAAPVLAVLSFPLLFLQNGSAVETQSSAWPAMHIVAYYMVFFACGWMLYRKRELLPSLAKYYVPLLGVGVGLGLWWMSKSSGEAINTANASVLMKIISAGSTAAFVVGFAGVFLHLFQRPSKTMRYISDSTYWMYIIHLPLVVWLNILLMPVELNAIAKFSIVMVVSAAIMLGTYQLFVRYTWIGVILNGPRIRAERKEKKMALRGIGLPALEPQPVEP